MKWKDAVILILSIATAAGSIGLMYVLVQAGDAVHAMATTPLPDTGLVDAGAIQSIVNTANLFLTLGWIWSILTLVVSVYAAYTSFKSLKIKVQK